MRKPSPASVQKAILDKIAQHITVFPATLCEAFPDGIAIPEGIRIRIRTGKGIELRFRYNGERESETLRLTPTVANVQEAARKLERIQQLIALGKFDEEAYREEFPDSRRFKKQPAPVVESVRTVGDSLDEWLLVRKSDLLRLSRQAAADRGAQIPVRPRHTARRHPTCFCFIEPACASPHLAMS